MTFDAPDKRGGGAWDVTILLATFNGAEFLWPLLRSLAAQSGVTWRLFWRDDGSSDETVAIMDSFAKELPAGCCTRVQTPAGRLGAARAYYRLADHAAAPGCLAFCDQDDVWLPDKLSRACAALGGVPAGVPGLDCARQSLVDAGLRRLGCSPPLLAGGFPNALTQNLATGCTVVMNREAADLLRAVPPPPGTLHDWWSYLLVTAAQGRVIIDDQPAVLYRQHGANLVGAPHTEWRRAVAALRRGPRVFMRVLRIHVAALIACGTLLPPSSRMALAAIEAALQAGPVARLRVLLRYRLRRQKLLESLLFFVWFLIG